MKFRRPVVAILDTGVGKHPWLEKGVSCRLATIGAEPEGSGVCHDPLEGQIDDFSGHGTFIAGLVRQGCPDADLLAVKVMGADGFVEETLMVNAVTELWIDHARKHAVDVVSMSFGYYHEAPEDLRTDASLLGPLTQLAKLGVRLVASAGNDATTRPLFPAAFSLRDIGLTSVGADNPNGTRALFSNAGAWVSEYAPGAALLSTQPVTFDGSLQPSARVRSDDTVTRETLDPDDFSGGFATWSGTSFAAPQVAARIAQGLIDRQTS